MSGGARGERRRDVERIDDALRRAGALLADFARQDLDVDHKAPGHPVTEADRAADRLLKELLPEGGDGWLSEETADDRSRLDHRRVWVVDPLDGTKEFVTGIPEWCVSVALVEDGAPVAGGIYNPAADVLVVGAAGLGVRCNGEPATVVARDDLAGARVPASRSEVKRGEWERWRQRGFQVVPTGSVAYKLSLVAAGRFDATWTLTPKHEWDVAGGAALVLAAGGDVRLPDGARPLFNRPHPKLPGFLAAAPGLAARLPELFREEGIGAGV